MDLDDTRLQETGAELEIVLVVVSYFAEQRMASRNTIRLKVNADMTWEDVRKIYAKYASSHTMDRLVISLWLPKEALDPKRAPEMLNSHLLKGNGTLEPLCDELNDDVKVSDTFRHLKKRPTRNIGVPPIVAKNENFPTCVPLPAVSPQHVALVQRFNKSKAELPGPPSVAAQARNYYTYQSKNHPILDGRFGIDKTLLPGPVHIYQSVFPWFSATATDASVEVSRETVLATETLIDHVSQISELPLGSSTQDIPQAVLDIAIAPGTPRRTDAAPSRCLVIVVEEEPDPSGSGPGQLSDVTAKTEFSYMARQLENDTMLSAGSCPAFLITIKGPYLDVCGAIWTTDVIVQHLLPGPIWLGRPNLLAESKIVEIARMFTALARAVLKLEAYNKQFVLPHVPPMIDVARFFPCAASYRDGASSQIVRFEYEAYLAGNQPSCLVFLATTVPSNDDSDPPRKIVVKFVERYGEAAHRLLAERNMAPALLYYGDIFPEDPIASRGCGSLRMVVMEYFEGRPATYNDLAALKAAEQAIKVLHNEHIVHGDVRFPNILVGPDGTMKLIDFDWAGEEGTVRYPIRVDTHVVDAPGVRPYGKIEAAHDRAMLERYIGPR
ncbi:hypothetical protein OH76DRAFT_1410738 [Lentinus brumalis]|uniref:Protein kinase domain-containing protein n=1 Tax=Lentinus brumalis TaxID=2498619 RepID=A0A371CRE5_9APHY|nr:hypothetical protein OH76DRAFT_1410738 [Polyporus brumalis]